MFEFEKFQEVEDINGVPADFRPFYVEKDGKHTLAMDNPIVKNAVTALTGAGKALGAEREITKTLKAQVKGVDLSALKDFGATPDEIAAGVTAKITELQDAISKGVKVNPETLRQEFAAAHGKELTARDSKISALTGQLQGLMVDQAAIGALAGLTGDPSLVLPFVREQVLVVEENGVMTPVVIVPGTNPPEARHSPTTGQRMTVPDLIAEMKDTPKYARLFDSTERKGPEDPGSTKKPVTGSTTLKREEMSGAQLIGAGIAKGQLGKIGGGMA